MFKDCIYLALQINFFSKSEFFHNKKMPFQLLQKFVVVWGMLWCGGCCGVSMLLRDGGHWDCLINLCAFDYPLITQESN
ncbi:hypothetical protein Hanom_Chr10g00933081 [Helianthus anomalus]